MPTRSKRPCRHVGCSALTDTGFCPDHKIGSDARYRGGTAAQRGYDRAWQKVRLQALKRDYYLCRYCQQLDPPRVTIATEVDHVIPISAAPQRRLDITNLLSTCHECHVKKHARCKP